MTQCNKWFCNGTGVPGIIDHEKGILYYLYGCAGCSWFIRTCTGLHGCAQGDAMEMNGPEEAHSAGLFEYSGHTDHHQADLYDSQGRESQSSYEVYSRATSLFRSPAENVLCSLNASSRDKSIADRKGQKADRRAGWQKVSVLHQRRYCAR